MVRRERFIIYILQYFLQCFHSLFYFSFVTNKGMDVAGVPLLGATCSFGFWELLPATGFAFIWRAAVAEMRFLLLVLGSVEEIVDTWNGVSVLDSGRVELP